MADTNYSPTFPMFPGDAFAITPNDSSDLTAISVVYVGVAGATGSVRVTTAQGNIVTFSGLAAGTVLPLQVRRVWVTGTDASGLVGIF